MDRNRFASDWAARKLTTTWKTFARSNPGDATKVDQVVTAFAATGTATIPVFATPYAKLMVDEWLALLAPDPAKSYNGLGLWGLSNAGAPAVQAAGAIEVGVWWTDDPSRGGLVGPFPNALIRAVYRIAIEIQARNGAPHGASMIAAEDADPAFICTYQGKQLHSYNGVDLLGNLGNGGYQKACADVTVALINAYGIPAIYIDNMHGDPRMNSLNGVVPDGYANADDWRHRAAIAWLVYVGGRIKAETGAYVFANCGDWALDGSTEYFDGGDAADRYWRQIKAAEDAAGRKCLDGFFDEFFMQRPTDNAPFIDAPGTSWSSNARGWQRLVSTAQTLGKDFHGLTYSDGKSAQRMAVGAYRALADKALPRRSTLWVPTSTVDPVLTTDVGLPAADRVVTGQTDHRQFEHATSYVNMGAAAATVGNVAIPATDSVLTGLKLFPGKITHTLATHTLDHLRPDWRPERAVMYLPPGHEAWAELHDGKHEIVNALGPDDPRRENG